MKDAVRVVVTVMQFDADEEVRHALSIMGSLYERNARGEQWLERSGVGFDGTASPRLDSFIAASLLVPDLGVRGAGVDVRAAQDENVRLAGGVGEVGRGVVVEVVAARRLGDGVGAGDGGEAGQRAVGVDGGELLLGGSVRGAVVEAAARQHAASGDHGAELFAVTSGSTLALVPPRT